MTLENLYEYIGGDYNQALKVLRIEKLIDKHIRKFPQGGVPEALIAAGKNMDPTAIFETAHAMKGVCANLGLMKLYEASSEIAEEYRPGNQRKFSDDEVRAKLENIERLYEKTAEGIRLYEEG